MGAWVVCTIATPGNRLRRTALPPLCSPLIAKIEIIDEVHRAASLVAESDPKDTVAGICPSRWLGECFPKSAARLE